MATTFLFTLAAFIVALGLLILFHEFGHYLVARWSGVKVLRFSIGFGKPLYTRRIGDDQTEWVISAVPLGGYVKMLDEHEGHVEPQDLPRAFNRKPVAYRFAIVAAGPLANFLLAILLYWALFILGVTALKPVLGPVQPSTPAASAGFHAGETIRTVDAEPVSAWQDVRWLLLSKVAGTSSSVTVETQDADGRRAARSLDLSQLTADDLEGDFLKKVGLVPYQPAIKPIIASVSSGSPGERAGLQPGDEIVAVDGKKVTFWEDLVQDIRESPGRALSLEILRNNRTVDLDVVPDTVSEGGKKTGKLGIAPKVDHAELEKLLTEVKYSPGEAIVKAVSKTWEMSLFTLRMIGKMVAGEMSWKNVSGPITIADYAGKSAQMGITSYLGFLAVISISLGVLNLLPIPVLDGGHLMYYVLEMIKGRPLSARAMQVGQQVGMALLFALMIFAIYNDISRLIPT
ncbi:MAG TPA: RIP metalloprotease RseP [Nitrosospira sp.]|nr:RIP metalloprotease RseP [Nitrosospira sp.]